jgi:hypothetical protein
MRSVLLAVGALAAAVLGAGREAPAGLLWRAAAQPIAIVVTNPGDHLEGAECPHEELCTLRKAIETANGDEAEEPVVITFDPETFPTAEPATITVGEDGLPPVTRAGITIDGAGGVRLQGNGALIGLQLEGDGARVFGLSIHGFLEACIVSSGMQAEIGGSTALGRGNRLGDCPTGIEARGAQTVVTGNRIGLAAADDSAAPVVDGIRVLAAGARIGGLLAEPQLANTISAAATAIRVGAPGSDLEPFAGVQVIGNAIGGGAGGVGTGVVLAQPSSGTLVRQNAFNAISGSAVVVAPNHEGVSVAGNTFVSNTFAGIGKMSIDLGGDGIRNPNDPSDSDSGPNELINHPVFTRAVQSELIGETGPRCQGAAALCIVQVYFAAHTPGGATDYGTFPVPFALVNTDSQGRFTLANPAVAPGQWVMAIVTDQDGNTSEFGPSTRVGAGTVACGNVTIYPGWNHAAFFGPQGVQLGLSFPENGAGTSAVASIYEFVNGTQGFLHWFAGTLESRTLTSLTPPQPYWFQAVQQVTFGGGFALSVPLPVELKAGWNDFVYIGAPGAVEDALASIAGKYSNVYRFVNDGAQQGWQKWGNVDTPGWVRDFSEMQPCAVYQLFVSENTTLIPLQP